MSVIVCEFEWEIWLIKHIIMTLRALNTPDIFWMYIIGWTLKLGMEQSLSSTDKTLCMWYIKRSIKLFMPLYCISGQLQCLLARHASGSSASLVQVFLRLVEKLSSQCIVSTVFFFRSLGCFCDYLVSIECSKRVHVRKVDCGCYCIAESSMDF